MTLSTHSGVDDISGAVIVFLTRFAAGGDPDFKFGVDTGATVVAVRFGAVRLPYHFAMNLLASCTFLFRLDAAAFVGLVVFFVPLTIFTNAFFI
jgi:hypothetical protein